MHNQFSYAILITICGRGQHTWHAPFSGRWSWDIRKWLHNGRSSSAVTPPESLVLRPAAQLTDSVCEKLIHMTCNKLYLSRISKHQIIMVHRQPQQVAQGSRCLIDIPVVLVAVANWCLRTIFTSLHCVSSILFFRAYPMGIRGVVKPGATFAVSLLWIYMYYMYYFKQILYILVIKRPRKSWK